MRFLTLLLLCITWNISQAADAIATYDVDFGGGSALDFADTLDDLGINAIYPENAAFIDIPAIRLRNVTQRDLFNALNIIGRDAPIRFEWGRSGNDMPLIIQPGGQVTNDQTNQIWVLISTGSRKTAQPFAIGPLLAGESNENGFSVDEITSAVASAAESAATAEGRSSELDFKYHEGTQLLIITGRVEDVRVAGMTLQTLGQSAGSVFVQGGYFQDPQSSLIDQYQQQKYRMDEQIRLQEIRLREQELRMEQQARMQEIRLREQQLRAEDQEPQIQ